MTSSRSIAAALLSLFLIAVAARPAAATTALSGKASIDDHTAYRGTNKTFQFTITNTSTTSAGSVQISRPSTAWTITGCSVSLITWTAVRTADHSACRFNSAAGRADNLKKRHPSSAFQVSAQTVTADTDTSGAWKVKLDRANTFNGGRDARVLKPKTPGALATTAYVWEILDAVVTNTPATIGSACPTGGKAAAPGATKNIAICGTEHSSSSLTPLFGKSSLGGSFVGTPGIFASAAITPFATDTVVANYDATQISGTNSSTATVISKLGSSSVATSPLTTLSGYVVLLDVTPPTPGTVIDGPGPTDLDTQTARTEMDAGWSGFSDTGVGIDHYDYNLSTSNSCGGEVIPTQNVGLAEAASDTNVQLTGDTTYFNCVRAVDKEGNQTGFVPSDGVVVKPLSFNPSSATIATLQTSTSSNLQNHGDTVCTVTSYGNTDTADFTVTTAPGPVASGSAVNVTVTRPSVISTGHSATITANAGVCGTATLTVSD